MDADIQGALNNIKTSWRSFEHKGKSMSKDEVLKVLNYALKKGYKTTAELSDSEVDSLINPQFKTAAVVCVATLFSVTPYFFYLIFFKMVKHGSLFSGIGGFDLAAQKVGFYNAWNCEKNDFCRKVLKKNFPDTLQYFDVLDLENPLYVDIISGGFPCQDISNAKTWTSNDANTINGINGNRSGLWFEMCRIIGEVRPLVVVAENVGGILTIENGLVFERVCLDLENEGYEVQPIVIPACAVGAPHRRDRVWIIAKNTRSDGRKSTGDKENASIREFGNISAGNGKRIYNESVTSNAYGNDSGQSGNGFSNGFENSPTQGFKAKEGNRFTDNLQDAPYTNGKRQLQPQGIVRKIGQRTFNGNNWSNWYEAATELCRVDDGLPSELDKLRNADRGKRIEALGNSIVPQVAYQIFQAI